MKKVYVVDLTDEEREALEELLSRGELRARKANRAHILLLADKKEGWTDKAIAKALHTSQSTVERTRRRFVERRRARARTERSSPPRRPAQAYGRAGSLPTRPGLEQPARRQEALDDAAVGRQDGRARGGGLPNKRRDGQAHAQKGDVKPWQRQQWCIPEVGAEFVWRMEDILKLYAREYDPEHPQVCFDEMPYQLIKEKRTPLPAEPGVAQRYDYEYERAGTRNLFMFFEPHKGWRHVEVTQRRTKEDFAHQMKVLVDEHYQKAKTIRVVLDNLNTHAPSALYETFSPEEAWRIFSKLEFHYTPKHASWLNMIEVEFSVLANQCTGERRIGDEKTLKKEIGAWEGERNEREATVAWRFTAEDAREKLKRLYPS